MAEDYLCSPLQVVSPGAAVSGTNKRPQPLPCDVSPVQTYGLGRVSMFLFFFFNLFFFLV